MDTKKLLYIGGGILVIGGFIIWYRKHEASVSAANDVANQNDALLASQLLQQPLAYTGGGGTSVSGPSVDTGNQSVQDLINSVLNPPAQPVGNGGNPTVQQSDATQSSYGRVTLHQNISNNVTPQPVMNTPYSPSGVTSDVVVAKTAPVILHLPLATQVIQ